MPKQISQKQTEQLIERLIEKMQKANELFLKDIGDKIKKLKNLKPSEAHKLIQILKYGGNYDDILKKISKYAEISTKEVDNIFASYSKKDMEFAKNYYDFRGVTLKAYDDFPELKKQTEALARIVKKEIYDYTRKKVLGYTVLDNDGNEVFKGLKEVYNDMLDTAFMNVGQGKDTFDSAIRSMLKSVGSSGLKTINYQSGRAVRLDSAMTMHLQSRLRELHNENQILFGEEFDSDGVEISVHDNPAPDHEKVQGRQFSTVKPSKKELSEWDKLQAGQEAIDYKGNVYNLHLNEDSKGYRPISEMNCYHTVFSIILGVSEPEYTDEQLQKIIDDNNEGFMFEGKHYTNYEGTQLQRQLERKIRQEKDIQILARASENNELVGSSQKNITILTNKYKELTQASDLPSKKNRMTVSGYRRTDVSKIKSNGIFISKEKQQIRLNYRKEYLQEKLDTAKNDYNKIPTENLRSWDISMKKILENDIKKYSNELNKLNNKNIEDKIIKLDNKNDCIELLKEINIDLKEKNLELIDTEVVIETSKKYYEIVEKYPFLEQSLQEKKLVLQFDDLSGGIIGQAERGGANISLNIDSLAKKDDTIFWGKNQTSNGYNMPCSKKDYMNYFQTHELGHIFDYRIIDNVEINELEDLSAREFTNKTNEYFLNNIYKIAEGETNLSREEVNKLLSEYGTRNNDEAMAEIFANANCGKPNALGKAFDKYFKELLK